jgi:hypothetical protein
MKISMKNSFYRLLLLAVVIFGASAGARAQACGYSTVTIYLQDADGKAVEKADLKFVRGEGGESAHFKGYTRTYWDAKRKAYVSVHGMCGEHYDAAVRISARGFEAAEQKLEFVFGAQGFILKLKRVGTSEKVSLEKLPCATREECPNLAGQTEPSRE